MSTPRITVIQLARFGDLIQTSPLLRRLKQQDPAARLTLVVDRRVREVAAMLEGVDDVLPVDLARLPWDPGASPAGRLTALRVWARPLMEQISADRLIVLNQDVVAGALAELIPARHRDGPRLRRPLPGPHRYLTASLADRRFNPIHLSEIWAAYAGSVAGRFDRIPEPKLRPNALGPGFALLNGESSSGSLKTTRYAVNLGAGAAGRRLPAASLAALIAEFGDGDEIVLLGLPADQPLARWLAASRPRQGGPAIVDLTGRTSLSELPGVLAGCAALVSSDTGTLQLAAATGTPSLGIFFAGANPVETGCYADGAVAVVRRDTLDQDETQPVELETMPVRGIHRMAVALAEGRPIQGSIDHDDPDHAVLVARTDHVGVRYSPVPGTRGVELGAAQRWLPALRRLVHGAAAPDSGHAVGGRSGREHDAAGLDELRALIAHGRGDDPETRWLRGLAQAFPVETAALTKTS